MTPTPQAIENAARALCEWDGFNPDDMVPYEQGAENKLLRSQPKDGPKIWPEMPYWKFRYAAQAERILSINLGDMVLVPKEALAWLFGEGPDADGHWFEPPEIKEGERKKPYWWRSRFRAMLSAAQGDADDQG